MFLLCYVQILIHNSAGLKSWNIPKTTGVAPTVRSGHTANMVEKKMYVFGGYGDKFMNDHFVLNCGKLFFSFFLVFLRCTVSHCFFVKELWHGQNRVFLDNLHYLVLITLPQQLVKRFSFLVEIISPNPSMTCMFGKLVCATLQVSFFSNFCVQIPIVFVLLLQVAMFHLLDTHTLQK